jgi:hypothetical protein
MMQIRNIREIFKKYFDSAIVPNRIIELGTYNAEFTKIIYDLRHDINDDFDFITFDFIKYPTSMPEEIRARLFKRIIYCETDIFNHIDFVGDLIKEKTLVLCDNGDKIKEVCLLAPYLRSDCVIMAHDYFETKEDFEKQEEWPSCEITWQDVMGLGLERYNYELMKSSLWLSMIKR